MKHSETPQTCCKIHRNYFGNGRNQPSLPLDCSSATSISLSPQPAVSMRSIDVPVSSTQATPGRSLRMKDTTFVVMVSFKAVL